MSFRELYLPQKIYGNKNLADGRQCTESRPKKNPVFRQGTKKTVRKQNISGQKQSGASKLRTKANRPIGI